MDLISNKTIEKLKYDLVRDGLVSYEQLEQAAELASSQNTNLGQALINSGVINENVLLKFLEDKLHIPYVDLEDYEIDRRCLNLINYQEAFSYKMLPLFQIEDILTVAMADPLDLFAIDDIIERTGKTLEPVISSEKNIIKKINEYYGAKGKVQDISNINTDVHFHWQEELHKEDLSEESIEDVLRAILKHAIKEGVHELYFEHDLNGLSVIFRRQPEPEHTGSIPNLLINPFIAKLKTLCGLDPLVNEIPQLGKLTFNVDEKVLTASISAFPTINGERVSLKIYHPPKKIAELDLDTSRVNLIKNAMNSPNVVLVCGSALSGKTHIIYSILSELIEKNKVAMTFESIVKYKLQNIYQCELKENVGFSLDKAMRFIEFQSPDIVYFEGIATQAGLDFFTSLTMKNKTLLTEFLADNMDDLRRKLAHPEFSLFKSMISCLIFIHNQDSIEVFDKEALGKYLI